MQALLGIKLDQSQKFLENGKRIPVTFIDTADNQVISVKTNEKDQYRAVQLSFGTKKKASRAEIGHAKGAKINGAPKFLREIRVVDDSSLPETGVKINPSEVFTPGDIIDVTGTSKGKGFAGVVKRHGFHGGPKTHGQSDRHRAPGSIGMGTTPGRVFKGKKMAGRMGHDRVTVTNLQVIDITKEGVLVVKGLVPGVKKDLLIITKKGEDKNFVPLYKDRKDEGLKSSAESSLDPFENKQADAASNEVSDQKSDGKVFAEEPKAEESKAASEKNLKPDENPEEASKQSSKKEVETEDLEEVSNEKKEVRGEEESANAKALTDKEDAGK